MTGIYFNYPFHISLPMRGEALVCGQNALILIKSPDGKVFDGSRFYELLEKQVESDSSHYAGNVSTSLPSKRIRVVERLVFPPTPFKHTAMVRAGAVPQTTKPHHVACVSMVNFSNSEDDFRKQI